MPFTAMVPEVGCKRVVSILMVVVLPAPFGPRNAKMLPFGTSKEMSFTAVNPCLNVLVRFLTDMAELVDWLAGIGIIEGEKSA